jgi:hypothetical protein
METRVGTASVRCINISTEGKKMALPRVSQRFSIPSPGAGVDPI